MPSTRVSLNKPLVSLRIRSRTRSSRPGTPGVSVNFFRNCIRNYSEWDMKIGAAPTCRFNRLLVLNQFLEIGSELSGNGSRVPSADHSAIDARHRDDFGRRSGQEALIAD